MRLTDFLLNRAQDLDDLSQVDASIRTLLQACEKQISASPWSFRKAGQGSRTTRRTLVVPANASGHVALHEIESTSRVQALAVRRHLAQDCH